MVFETLALFVGKLRKVKCLPKSSAASHDEPFEGRVASSELEPLGKLRKLKGSHHDLNQQLMHHAGGDERMRMLHVITSCHLDSALQAMEQPIRDSICESGSLPSSCDGSRVASRRRRAHRTSGP